MIRFRICRGLPVPYLLAPTSAEGLVYHGYRISPILDPPVSAYHVLYTNDNRTLHAKRVGYTCVGVRAYMCTCVYAYHRRVTMKSFFEAIIR